MNPLPPPDARTRGIAWAAVGALALVFVPAALTAYPIVNPFRYFEWPIRRWAVLTAHWPGLLLLALLALLAQAAGRRLLRLLTGVRDLPAAWAGFALPLGLGLLGYVTAFLCWAHCFNRPAVSAAAVLVAAFAWREIGDLLRSARNLPTRVAAARRAPKQAGWIGFAAVALVVIVGLCGLSLVFSLAPPHQSDALRYHLSAPERYLREGGFVYLPHSAFANFPFTIEMLFGLGLLFVDGYAARGVHWLFLAATLSSVYAAGRRYGPPGAGLLGCALFASIPFVALIASWGFIEVALSAVVLLCARALVLWAEAAGWIRAAPGDCPSPAGASRVFAASLGLALGVKYTSVLFAAFLFVAVLFLAWPTRRRDVRGLAAAFLLAGAIGSPWYIKNALVTGNPVFPLANGIFHAEDWSETETILYFYHAGAKGRLNEIKFTATPGERLTDFLTLPLRAVAARSDGDVSARPFGFRLKRESFGDWPVGWIFPVLLPLALVYLRRDGPLRWILIVAAFLALTWAYTYRDNRFLLPAMAIAAPVLATAAARVFARSRIEAAAVTLLCAAGILYAAFDSLQTAYGRHNVLSVVNGESSREDYLASTHNSYQAFRWLEATVRPGERVLIDSDQRTYYARFDYVAADFFNTPVLWTWAREAESTEALHELLRANVDWVAVNVSERTAIWNGFPAILAHFLPEHRAVPLVRLLLEAKTPAERQRAMNLLLTAVEQEPAFARYHEVLTRLDKVNDINGVVIYRTGDQSRESVREPEEGDGGRSGI